MADYIKSVDKPLVHGLVVVNPDGTSITGGATSGVAAFSDSGSVDRKGLVDIDRHVQVDVLTMPASTIDTTGLATSANQTTIIGHLDGVEGSLSSLDTKTPSLGQALAAASSPVVLTAVQMTTLTPPAAITNFANETGGNLASIKAKTDNIPSLGQALAAASTPVVLTAAQITTLTPIAAITGFATEATLGTRLAEATFTTRFPVQGQALAAASVPVVLTAAQVTALTPPAAITGFATSALQTTQDTSINTLLKPASTLSAVTTVTNLSQQGGVAISLNTGVRDTGTQRVTIATNDVVPVTDNSGSLTVDAPVGTPVFMRLSDGTTAISTLPVSLASVPSHAVTNAGTFAVQSTEATYATSSVTSIAGSASSVQLLASTAGRKGAYFYNDSTAICYLKLGTTASTSSFTIAMAATTFYELPNPNYTGRIDAIWASATGNMRITEIT